MSILNFPNRGPWGDNRYRGNASGNIYKAIYDQLKPASIVEVFSGSGTAGDVAREMRIPIVELDLKDGFDAVRMSIVDKVGQESDLVFSHPPYLSMVKYSGNMWGDKPHPADLSHVKDTDEFYDLLQAVLMNQREATRRGGVYGTLVGDIRKNGQYTSMQAEILARMPKNELRSIMIKGQFNTTSGRNSYGRMRFAPINHEYILLWERTGGGMHAVLASVTKANDRRIKGTWRAIIRHALVTLKGKASLQDLYSAVADTAPEQNLAQNPNWQAKVRQVLQRHPNDFRNETRGTWALT